MFMASALRAAAAAARVLLPNRRLMPCGFGGGRRHTVTSECSALGSQRMTRPLLYGQGPPAAILNEHIKYN